MPRWKFTIKNLAALLLAVACGLGVYFWLNKIETSKYWNPPFDSSEVIESATVTFYDDENRPVVRTLDVADAARLIEIARRSPVFTVSSAEPAPSFPPIMVEVKIDLGKHVVRLEVLEFAKLICTDDSGILQCHEYQSELVEMFNQPGPVTSSAGSTEDDATGS